MLSILLTLAILTTSSAPRDMGTAVPAPAVDGASLSAEGRALKQLIESSKVWRRIGRRDDWQATPQNYILDDLEALDALKKIPGLLDDSSVFDEEKVLISIDRRAGVTRRASWSFHRKDRVEKSFNFLSIRARIYRDEAAAETARKAVEQVAELVGGGTSKRGRRFYVTGGGMHAHEGRLIVEVDTLTQNQKNHRRMVDALLDQLKTLIRAEEKKDAKERAKKPAVSQVRDVTLETLADPKALAKLQKPGRVLFADDFESATSRDKYFDLYRGELVHFIEEPTKAHRGKGSVEFNAPANGGNASGGGVSGWLGDAGHECVYFRRYIFFPEDYDQGHLHHTGGGMSGVASNDKWDGMGSAGQIPKGDEGFSAAFEPWRDWGRFASPGFFLLYVYWVDMKPGKREGEHYGNMFEPPDVRRVVPSRGKWVCLEQMITVNTIGHADGELATWIDGKLYQHLVGFRWRTSEEVKLKRFRFGIYVHNAEKENRARYDDVVLSTGYVGPVAAHR